MNSAYLDKLPMKTVPPTGLALSAAAVALMTILAAWAFQWAGYAPCEICLWERLPYYVGVPLALLAIVLPISRLQRVAYAAVIAVFAIGTALGAYHAGLEWHLWAGPSSCTGLAPNDSHKTLLEQLNEVHVVPCDAIALRVFGLSLAVWNTIFSIVIVGLLGRAYGIARPLLRKRLQS